jgi:uncharacterized protein
MTIEPEATGAALPAGQEVHTGPGSGGIRNIFVGPRGIRPGWRLLLFIGILAALWFIVVQNGMRRIPAARELMRQAQSGGEMGPDFELLFETTALTLTSLAIWIMSRIERRPFGTYGVPLQSALGKLFWQGVIWGLAFETIEILGIFALGGYSFGSIALAGPTLVKYAIAWAIGFVLVGLFEESLFRSYAQYTLASGIGFWPAAFLISGLFGATHLFNQGEGWVGALSVFCFGIFGCLTLRRTGNLWFVIGFHAATDYAESFIYSTPDSGILAKGHLLNSTFHGPTWLTGGTIGPEGSVMDFVVFALAFALFAWVYRAKDNAASA